jgi:p-hydroxybenzoate 3-monooxygenase
VLDQGTVDLLTQTGLGDRMKRDGFVHHGINLAFSGQLHRINMFELTGGRAVTVYAQHEVLKDLIARRLADDGHLRFGVSDVQVDGITGEQPTITFTQDGQRQQLECDFVAGCDGSRTFTRYLIPEGTRTDFSGSTRSPGSASSPRLRPRRMSLSKRIPSAGCVDQYAVPSVRRMYFQCDPQTNVDDWSEDRVCQGQIAAGRAGGKPERAGFGDPSTTDLPVLWRHGAQW